MGRKRTKTLQRNRQRSCASLASPPRRRTRSNAPKLPVEGTPTPLPHLLVRPPKRHPQVTDAGYDPIATPVFSTPREARKRRVSDTPVRPRRVSETPVPPAKKTSESPNQALPPVLEPVLRISPAKKRPRTRSHHDRPYNIPSQTPFPKNIVRRRRVSDTPLPSVKNKLSTPIYNSPPMPDLALGTTPQSKGPVLQSAGQKRFVSSQNPPRRQSERLHRVSETPEWPAKNSVTKSPLQRPSSDKPSRNSSAPFQGSALLASPGLLSAHVSLTVESVFSYEDEQSKNKALSDRECAQKTQRRISFGAGTPRQQTQQHGAEIGVNSPLQAVQPLSSQRQHESAAIRLPPSRAPPSIPQCSQADEQASLRQSQRSAQSSGSSSAIQANDRSPARQTGVRKRACVREVASPADDSNCSWGADGCSPASSEVALFQQKKMECADVAVTERGRSPVVCEQSAPQQTDSEATRSEEEEEQERGAKWKSGTLTTQDFLVLKPRRVGQTVEDAMNAANVKVDLVEDVVVTQSSVADSNVRSAQTNVSGDECSSTQSPASVDRKRECAEENEKVQEAAVYCRSVLVSIPSGALVSPDGSDR